MIKSKFSNLSNKDYGIGIARGIEKQHNKAWNRINIVLNSKISLEEKIDCLKTLLERNVITINQYLKSKLKAENNKVN